MLTFLARRFVAGETIEPAIACGRRLGLERVHATFDLPGRVLLDYDEPLASPGGAP